MSAQPTRRGLLGVMAALPQVGAVVMPASATSPDSHAWIANLARYRRLDAAPLDGLPEADQEAVMDDCSDALTDLMQTPAPDQLAVADKLKIYIREFGDITTRGHLGDVIADLRRLAAGGALTWDPTDQRARFRPANTALAHPKSGASGVAGGRRYGGAGRRCPPRVRYSHHELREPDLRSGVADQQDAEGIESDVTKQERGR